MATAVTLDNKDANPIMISVGFNAVMQRWEAVLIVANFPTEHAAKSAANKLVKLVERDLGSKRTKFSKGH